MLLLGEPPLESYFLGKIGPVVLRALDVLLVFQYDLGSNNASKPQENPIMEYIPTDRELEALKVLWRHGEATVREIYDHMNEDGAKLAYTTVLSLLQVMEQKGLVRHRQSGKAYLYSAEAQRDRTFRTLAGGFLEKVFDGAVDEYLVHALQSRRLSADGVGPAGKNARRRPGPVQTAPAERQAVMNASTSRGPACWSAG